MTIGFRESLKQFLHSAPARKKRAFHLAIPDRSRLRTRRLQAPTDLIVIAGRLGSSDKSSKAPSKQGALNQGLDPLRFFLADFASVQSTPCTPPAISLQAVQQTRVHTLFDGRDYVGAKCR